MKVLRRENSSSPSAKFSENVSLAVYCDAFEVTIFPHPLLLVMLVCVRLKHSQIDFYYFFLPHPHSFSSSIQRNCRFFSWINIQQSMLLSIGYKNWPLVYFTWVERERERERDNWTIQLLQSPRKSTKVDQNRRKDRHTRTHTLRTYS